MGGDSFEGTQKLTNEQYEQLVPQILQALSDLYTRGEPYIPLPQKQLHGDIDILMILKPTTTPIQLIHRLNITQFLNNNNDTINSVYKNKQVDFCFKKSDRKFEMAKFYKSYSGIGAHLGLFLPSKEVKLSDAGLFALGYREHIKFQFLITDSVEEILGFYGLDYGRFCQGFKTRKQLFQYLRGCCFLNQKKMLTHQTKNKSKLTKFFMQYLQSQPNLTESEPVLFPEPLTDTLNYFKKLPEFKAQFKALLESVEKKQQINKKFNATHLMEHFKIKPKEVNKMKEKFMRDFKDNQEYLNYVDQNSLEDILKRFQKCLCISPPKQEEVQPLGQKQQQP